MGGSQDGNKGSIAFCSTVFIENVLITYLFTIFTQGKEKSEVECQLSKLNSASQKTSLAISG